MKPIPAFLRNLLTLLSAFLLVAEPTAANQNIRDWTLGDGKQFRGEIMSVDEGAGEVILRLESGAEARFATTEFSNIDKAWILEWTELAEELEAAVRKFGGRMESHEGKGPTLTTGFHVYLPSGGAEPGKLRPMMVLFDPGGQAKRYLLRHIEGAEAAKMIVVACEVFRNHMPEADSKKRFAELFPLIEKAVPHDPARRFMGGTSGGAWRAYNLTTDLPDIPWAGIYANGGWLGGSKNYGRPYPPLKVVMVNGDNDKAANTWVDDDMRVLHARGCTVSVMAFEGGHQIPPPSVQTKAFQWLLGELR